MKKTLLSSFLLGIMNISLAQNVTIEKSITGVQIGLFGTELYNETRIVDNVSLRSQLGLNVGIFGGNIYEKTGFILYPILTIEPKWYYNLDKRVAKNKNIQNNGANYYSLSLNYSPDWFVISNYDNLTVYNTLSIIPTWGFRRNFAENFNYEFNIGLGYGVSFRESYGLKNETGAVMDLGFKIGYDF